MSNEELLSKFQKNVLDIIKSCDIINGKELAKTFGMTDTRQVRQTIQELRLKGYPICIAPNGGYFYSTRKEDIEYTVYQLLKRATELMDVAEAIINGADNYENKN